MPNLYRAKPQGSRNCARFTRQGNPIWHRAELVGKIPPQSPERAGACSPPPPSHPSGPHRMVDPHHPGRERDGHHRAARHHGLPPAGSHLNPGPPAVRGSRMAVQHRRGGPRPGDLPGFVSMMPVGPSGPEMGQNGPFWQEGSGRDDRGHRTWRRTHRCIRRNPGMGMETRRGFRSIIRRRWRWVSIGLGIGAVLGCMYGVLGSADCLQRGLQLPRVGIPGLGRRHGDSGGRDVLLPGLEAGEGPGRCGMRVGPGTPSTEGQAGARQRGSRNPGGCRVRNSTTEKACRQPAF